MNNSNFFRLNFSDVGKSILVGSLGIVAGTVYQFSAQGQLPSIGDLGAMGQNALQFAVGYLLKNLLSGPAGKFLNPS